jgi:short subunit dehydrogenase-like uncharacterized protein
LIVLQPVSCNRVIKAEDVLVRRIVVVGGYGFFGRALCDQLRRRALRPIVGARRANAELVVDVENEQSIHQSLRTGDVVIDVVGPFQKRTTMLVECSMKIGFDLIDLSDSLAYAEHVYQLKPKLDGVGNRVLTACSVVSAVSAAAVRLSGVESPTRVTGILVPATRHTAVDATAASLFNSVGRAIQVYDGKSLVQRTGWQTRRSFHLPKPIGTRTGFLFECADSITLPAIWPDLETAQYFVDTNVHGLNALFTVAARSPLVRRLLDRLRGPGLKLSRLLGRSVSGVGYTIEDGDGRQVEVTFTAREHGYLTAVAPAVLAAECLCNDRMKGDGLITPERHVDAQQLLEYLTKEGICCSIQRGEHGRVQSG